MHNIYIDVHPPLYYFMLLSVFSVLTFFKIGFSEVIVGKIFSIVPLVLLLIFSLIILRKRFGWLFNGIFSIAMISAPRVMHFSTEVRSYSWGILFLTLAFYSAYEVCMQPSKIKNYIFLSLFALLSLYTHYGTIFMVFAIYLLLFIFLLKNNLKHKEIYKLNLKNYIFSVFISLLGFCFWIPILLNQIKIGNADWAVFPTIDYLYDLFYSLFTATMTVYHIIIAILLFTSFIILTIYYFKKKKNKTNFLATGLILLTIVILITLLISLIQPVWIYKSFYLMLGIFWLSYAFLLTKAHSNKIFVPLLLILLLSSSINIMSYFAVENDNNIALNEMKTFINSIDDNKSTIISFATDCDNSPLIYDIGSHLIKNNVYFIDFRFRFLQLNDSKNYRTGTIKYNVENTTKSLSELVENSLKDNKNVYIFSREDFGENISFNKYFVSIMSSLRTIYPILEKSYLNSLFNENFKNDFILKKIINLHKSNDDAKLMGFNEGKETYVYEIM
ncbi:MAG: hypothetical protein LBT66_06965 [Methanobrevibacter sp.]|nr:hypothetical protein [Candidatus Methanovirga meridionalis]